MARPSQSSLPSNLKETRRQFEAWRRIRSGRSRIPESLWSLAAAAARAHGIHRTSKALGLDYMRLKNRMAGEEAAPPSEDRLSPFVELDLGRSVPCSECTLELQEIGGARMTVHFKGAGSLDLIGLTGAFFGRSR